MVEISHKPSLMGGAIARWLRPDFWETHLTEEGICLTRWFGGAVMIPWGNIECLDLAGLEPRHGISRRFFLLMVSNGNLLERACRFSSPRKTWFAASNVLGLTSISDASAKRAREELQRIAAARKIKLDAIYLPG